MISSTELLDAIAGAFPLNRRVAAFPYVYVEVVSDHFSPDSDDREDELAETLKMSPRALRELCTRLFFRITPLRPEEPTELPAPRSAFWLGALSTVQAPPAAPTAGPRALHFYGYKGGQGRSTALALFARALAADGWRVLALDLDAEAPSLDILLRRATTRPEHTLVGLRGGADLRPLRAWNGERGGYVELVAFAPDGAEWAHDAASLAMEMALYPPGQIDLVRPLTSCIAGYDLVLLDHRTGLAPTVLPWLRALPGGLVVFARMDGQSGHATAALRSLWQHCAEPFGALLSLGLPFQPREEAQGLSRQEAARLLQGLAERMTTDDTQVDEEDLVGERFMVLPYDNQVAGGHIPAPGDLGGATQATLSHLRGLLGLHQPPVREAPQRASLSGDQSGGVSIETDALRTLLAENELDWVVGRKGTGKTWLLRRLHELGRGEALLVPDGGDDSLSAGVPARDLAVERATTSSTLAPRAFWWALIAAGLQVETTDREALLAAFVGALATPDPTVAVETAARARVSDGLPPKLLLIDGLEMAFPADHTIRYIEELVRVVHTIRSTPRLREALRLQVFIRTDLFHQPDYENIEQLSQGRTLALQWTHRAALNLLVAKLISLPWYAERFPDAIAEIKGLEEALRRAEVPEGVCEDALERVFPEKAGVVNTTTRTFWRTFFCEEGPRGSSYFPRLLLSFLEELPRVVNDGSRPGVADGRVAPWVLAETHAAVTRGAFLQATLAELRWMVPDREALDAVIKGLEGKSTPCDRADLERQVAEATGRSPEDLRPVFDAMLRLGMFEGVANKPGHWRATRLYRTALRMKFSR